MRPTSAFGEWLKEQRKALDLTQAELAQQVGCAEVTLRKLEAGTQRPSKPMAARLAEVLQIAPPDQAAFVRFARGESATLQKATAPAPAPRWRIARLPATLPSQPTSLLGRNQELAMLRQRLLHDQQRLVTLLGPPGVGKTRLALEAARELATHFADGVHVVGLATLDDAVQVGGAICQALGLQESGLPALARLKLNLSDKHLLLVLDNVEHLLPAAPVLAELLASCPWLHILATSRAPLRLRAEWQFPLAPLALPDLSRLPEPAALLGYAAIALFVERAQAVEPDFALTAANAAAIAAVCAQLDGLPLAIELAAARVKVLPPEALLARLRGHLLLSSAGPWDGAPRHQTLRHAIDWSYQLLTPVEQMLLRRLGSFHGGCMLESAGAVCGGEGASDLFEELASLVDKNLVYRKLGMDGEVRFLLLETIHGYALERLAESGELAAVRRRHAKHYLALAEAAESHLYGAEQLDWFQRLEAEHDNLRAALGWCVECDPLLGLRLANALGQFWFVRAHYSEGSHWLDALLVRAGENAPASLRAWALYQGALLAVGLDAFAGGRALGKAALALARTLQDRLLVARLCFVLSILTFCQGEHGQARGLWADGLAIARALDDKRLVASFLVIGLTCGLDDAPLPVTVWTTELLPLIRKAGDRSLLGQCLSKVGSMIALSGSPDQATSLLREALAVSRQLGDKRNMIFSLEGLGLLAVKQLDYAQAETYFHQMLELARQAGDLGFVAAAYLNLGRLAHRQGKTIEALGCCRQGLMTVKGINHHLVVANCLAVMAALAETPNPAIDVLRATRLLGAADAIFGLDHLPLDPAVAATCERIAAAARARSAHPVVAAAWMEGQAMSLDEAIAYGIACCDQAEVGKELHTQWA